MRCSVYSYRLWLMDIKSCQYGAGVRPVQGWPAGSEVEWRNNYQCVSQCTPWYSHHWDHHKLAQSIIILLCLWHLCVTVCWYIFDPQNLVYSVFYQVIVLLWKYAFAQETIQHWAQVKNTHEKQFQCGCVSIWPESSTLGVSSEEEGGSISASSA